MRSPLRLQKTHLAEKFATWVTSAACLAAKQSAARESQP
jgi:hypothetical protein